MMCLARLAGSDDKLQAAKAGSGMERFKARAGTTTGKILTIEAFIAVVERKSIFKFRVQH
jgi:hypothetical protein